MDWNNMVISEICDVMTVRVETGTCRQIINRKWYGISFCATPGAKLVYYHNGNQYVSDSNHAVILPKGQTYMLYGKQTGDFPLINFQCTDSFQLNEFVTIPIDNLNAFLRDHELIGSYSLFLNPAYRMETFSILYKMFAQLFIQNDSSKQQQLLLPVIRYLEEHYMDHDISVEKLASEAHVSVTYLRRIFKERYAVSPKQYIINARITKAKELLRNSNYYIGAIAYDCGFGSECHFCRVFKEYVGFTPSEYRNKSEQIL